MKDNRVFNFNPGPATLPLPVLEEIREEFLNYKNTGMSIIETSHRSPAFDGVINDAVTRTKRLLGLDDNFHVCFIQGGASMQFAMIPMNLLNPGESADYINTGTWSTKAIKEAQKLGKTIRVAASSEDKNFSYIPDNIKISPDAVYVHITTNNTIKGTQWHRLPDTGRIPLVADASSDIMSRPLDISKFGLIYAGAQKNIGPAGVCMVIVRKDLLGRAKEMIPTMLDYTTYVEKNSLYNTPPCFAIYTISKVLAWLEDTIGGLEAMDKINRKKAGILYDYMDQTDFYLPTAATESRSLMNVTFRLADEELEKRFVAEAAQAGLVGLKGHRSVGGCRASIYNAMPTEGVEKLVEFMADFEKKNS